MLSLRKGTYLEAASVSVPAYFFFSFIRWCIPIPAGSDGLYE